MSENIVIQYKKEANRIEEDSTYSEKSHYNASDYWSRVHYWIGIPNTIMIAASGIEAFNGEGLVAGVLAIIASSVAALNTFLNPNERSSNHKRCAGEYLTLKNQSRRFREIDCERITSDDKLYTLLKELVNKRDNLNATSLVIPNWAYKKAKEGIANGEAKYKEK
jgi:hypothetical protein